MATVVCVVGVSGMGMGMHSQGGMGMPGNMMMGGGTRMQGNMNMQTMVGASAFQKRTDNAFAAFGNMK